MKRHWNAMVVKRWVPLGNLCSAMAGDRAVHWITLASRANASEEHDSGT
jgi:hypothetical protein